MSLLDIVGWGGSALLVFSLLQARVLRFRALNLGACLILLVFNALIEVWPMVGMNAVLAGTNVWFLVRLMSDRHDETAFVVLRGDETVGMVLIDADHDAARVRLDYVTQRFRDFTPGEFVWRDSGVLTALGFRHVMTPPDMVDAYYGRVGFRRNGTEYVLDL